jgi:hypothetical protein
VQKKRKESENEELEEHFAFPHPLSPLALQSFRSASSSLFSRLKALGVPSQEAFVTSLANLVQKKDVHDLTPPVSTLRSSFAHLPPPTVFAATLLCNELVHIQSSGNTLEEAVEILTMRLQLQSGLMVSDAPLASHLPLDKPLNIESMRSPTLEQPSSIPEQDTGTLPIIAKEPKKEDLLAPESDENGELDGAYESDSISGYDEEAEMASGDFSQSQSSSSDSLEESELMQLIDNELANPSLTGNRKRTNQDIAPHRSDLLSNLSIAIESKRYCFSECPP